MLINDLNTVCVALDPLEDHTPLIVDANRVVPLQISVQLLESVRWRHQQILEAGSGINHHKFSLRWPCYALELTNEELIEQVLGTPVAEGLDHAILYRIPVYSIELLNQECPERLWSIVMASRDHNIAPAGST